MLIKRIVVVLVLLVATEPAHAAVIYDNGVSPSPTSQILVAETGASIRFADDFTLPAESNTVSDVHWSGLYTNLGLPVTPPASLVDDFQIDFYASTTDLLGNAIPQATPFVSHVVSATFAPSTRDGFFDFYAVLPETETFTPDTLFWISITHQNEGLDLPFWGWTYEVTTTGNAAAINGPPGWFRMTTNGAGLTFDFALTNDFVGTSVPEPSTLLLLGVGVVGAAGAMRIRRRK